MNSKSAPQERLFIWNRSNLLQLKSSSEGSYPEFRYHYRGRSPLAVLDYLAAHIGQANVPLEDRRMQIICQSLTIHDFYGPGFQIKGVELQVDTELYSTLLRKWGVEQLVVVDIDSPDQYSLQVFDISGGLRQLDSQEVDDVFLTYDPEQLIKGMGMPAKLKQLKIGLDMKTAWLVTGELAFFMKSDVVSAVSTLFACVEDSLPLLNYAYHDKYQLLNVASAANISPISYFAYGGVCALNAKLLPGSDPRLALASSPGGKSIQLSVTRSAQMHYMPSSRYVMGLSGLEILPGYLWLSGRSVKHSIHVPSPSQQREVLTAKIGSEISSVADIELAYNLPVKKSWRLPLTKQQQQRKNFQRKSRRKVVIFLDRVTKDDLEVVQGQRVLQGDVINRKRAVNFLFETKQYLAPVSGVIDLRDFDRGVIQIISEKSQLEDFGWAASAEAAGKGVFDVISIAIPLQQAKGLPTWGRLCLAKSIEEALSFVSKVNQSVVVCDFILSKRALGELYEAGASVVIGIGDTSTGNIAESLLKYKGFGTFSSSAISLPKTYTVLLQGSQSGHVYFNANSRELLLPVLSTTSHGKKKFEMLKKSPENWMRTKISKGSRILLITHDKAFLEGIVLSSEVKEKVRARLVSSGQIIPLGQEQLFLL